MMVCAKCEQEWDDDRFNAECPQPDWCFRCRSKSIGVSFSGGKEQFHSFTTKEFNEKQISEARKNGLDPVPVETGKAWNAGAAGTMKKIGEVSKKVGAFGGKPSVDKGVSA